MSLNKQNQNLEKSNEQTNSDNNSKVRELVPLLYEKNREIRGLTDRVEELTDKLNEQKKTITNIATEQTQKLKEQVEKQNSSLVTYYDVQNLFEQMEKWDPNMIVATYKLNGEKYDIVVKDEFSGKTIELDWFSIDTDDTNVSDAISKLIEKYKEDIKQKNK